MTIIFEHVSFVKEQIAHYDSMAIKNRSVPHRRELYISIGTKLRSLLSYLEDRAAQATVVTSASIAAVDAPDSISLSATNPLDSAIHSKLPANFFDNPFALSASDVAGLPKEALGELNITESDKLEIMIVDLINAGGGVLILDKLIAGLYHLSGEIHQRVALTAKLYRMSRKGLVYSVPKKRGVYTTTKPENVEVEAGADDMEDASDLV